MEESLVVIPTMTPAHSPRNDSSKHTRLRAQFFLEPLPGRNRDQSTIGSAMECFLFLSILLLNPTVSSFALIYFTHVILP